MLNMENYRI